MISNPDSFLGRVLRKIAETYELEVRLELRQEVNRYLTIAKYIDYDGSLDMIGWVCLYAKSLDQLQVALSDVHEIATTLGNNFKDELDFSVALDGKDCASSTEQVRIILDVPDKTRGLTLITFHKVNSNWCRDHESCDCELGLDDLKDIIEALEEGAACVGKEMPPHQDEENSNG